MFSLKMIWNSNSVQLGDILGIFALYRSDNVAKNIVTKNQCKSFPGKCCPNVCKLFLDLNQKQRMKNFASYSACQCWNCCSLLFLKLLLLCVGDDLFRSIVQSVQEMLNSSRSKSLLGCSGCSTVASQIKVVHVCCCSLVHAVVSFWGPDLI